MINPHLVADLKRAERAFRKGRAYYLARAAYTARGDLADSPDETEARHLVRLAFGDIHA